jgi:flagellar motor switch protein FliN/FliY
MTPEPQISSESKQASPPASEATPALSTPQEPTNSDSSSHRIPLASFAARLPLQLDLRVPLPSFRVHHLLSLEKGQVIESAWPHTEDLPLWSGGVHLVWTEFEVVDQKLAVRVTRLV